MSNVIRDQVVTDFLEAQWREATSGRRRQIAESMVNFAREHPNTASLSYWSGTPGGASPASRLLVSSD